MSRALTLTETAKMLNTTPATLKKWTEAGDVPYWFITPGGRYRYSQLAIEEHQREAARRAAS